MVNDELSKEIGDMFNDYASPTSARSEMLEKSLERCGIMQMDKNYHGSVETLKPAKPSAD